ncbi:MAG TPA: hypothetical protein VMW74_01400 [Nitrosopumilaceae archaeon]|nr:hypothetical protein [Nitrosopumilaceae archaeon]
MINLIQSKINQYKLLSAELKQLNYDFEKAQTLQEKVVIHNLIVSKGKEKQKNQEQLKQIRTQNEVIAYAKIRKTKKRK